MGDRNHQLCDGPGDEEIDPTREFDDRGASLIEYVLMVSLIALVCIMAVGYFQEETAQSFSTSASHLDEAGY